MRWWMNQAEKDAIYKLLSQTFPKDRGFKSVSCQTDCGMRWKTTTVVHLDKFDIDTD